MNPILEHLHIPTPAFDKIEDKHFEEAFQTVTSQHREKREQFLSQPAQHLEEFIAGYEAIFKEINAFAGVFYNLKSAHSTEARQELAQQFSPEWNALTNELYTDNRWVKAIQEFHSNLDEISAPDTKKWIEDAYKSLQLQGAYLTGKKLERFVEIQNQLSQNMLQFGNHVLSETNSAFLELDQDEMKGLPDSILFMAEQNAQQHGAKKQYLLGMSMPEFQATMESCSVRSTRKQLHELYTQRCQEGQFDNSEIIIETIQLRRELAELLGFPSFADMSLADTMAKQADQVGKLLASVLNAALSKLPQEENLYSVLLEEDGFQDDIQKYDWWYYHSKAKQQKFKLDDEQVKQYFEFSHILTGMFKTIEDLFGIQVERNLEIPVYHDSVEVYELKETGNIIGRFYLDPYYRTEKQSGAWMNSIVQGSETSGNIPHIVNVCNFTAPTEDSPCLLSLDEMETLFHEFGHALHGLLSKTKFTSQAGTSVSRDLVEFPSQFFENWSMTDEFLSTYAVHYKSGEQLPTDLKTTIQTAASFNRAFFILEYSMAAILDYEYHTSEAPISDIHAFEQGVRMKWNLPVNIEFRYKSHYFKHIFAGGYSLGYYAYLWSELLEADAFAWFKETSPYDTEKAAKYRTEVLAKGGSQDEELTWKKFRGQDADPTHYFNKMQLV